MAPWSRPCELCAGLPGLPLECCVAPEPPVVAVPVELLPARSGQRDRGEHHPDAGRVRVVEGAPERPQIRLVEGGEAVRAAHQEVAVAAGPRVGQQTHELEAGLGGSFPVLRSDAAILAVGALPLLVPEPQRTLRRRGRCDEEEQETGDWEHWAIDALAGSSTMASSLIRPWHLGQGWQAASGFTVIVGQSFSAARATSIVPILLPRGRGPREPPAGPARRPCRPEGGAPPRESRRETDDLGEAPHVDAAAGHGGGRRPAPAVEDGLPLQDARPSRLASTSTTSPSSERTTRSRARPHEQAYPKPRSRHRRRPVSTSIAVQKGFVEAEQDPVHVEQALLKWFFISRVRQTSSTARPPPPLPRTRSSAAPWSCPEEMETRSGGQDSGVAAFTKS